MSRRLWVAGSVVCLAFAGGPASAEEPPAAAPTRQQGRALLAKGDFAGAEAVFTRLTELDAKDAESWFLLGSARHSRGDFESALGAHRTAATFARVRPAALYNVTCALARLGRSEEALAAFAEAVAAGFRDRGTAATDADVASIRSDARFAKTLKPLVRGAAAFVEPVRVLAEIDGETQGEEFGWVARAVGDLDGDGVADFAATSPSRRVAGGVGGRVGVYSSKSGRRLFAVDGAAGDALGTCAASAGDVDGDGTPDVVASAVQGASAHGYAIVLSGKTGAELLRVTGEAPGDGFGVMLCSAGDVDGDGRADIAVGAWRADGAAGADSGRVTVHSGRTGVVLVKLEGERAGDLFGSSVACEHTGGERLLAVGAMDAGPGNRGRVYVHRIDAKSAVRKFTVEAAASGVHFGQYFLAFAGDVDGDGASDLFASDFADAATGAATGRFVVARGTDGKLILDLPGRSTGEGLGTSISVCGDVNGDGRADLIVGAWQNSDGAPAGGRCYLVSGKDGAVLSTYTSRMDQDTLGFDAVGLGDVDGDGGTDFLLSAAWSEVHGAKTGRVWIVAGPARVKR